MSTPPTFTDGIWAVDFEFHPAGGNEGNNPIPVCMVARNLVSSEIIRLWQDELFARQDAPFPVGKDALFTAYFASAEVSCFLALGWELPTNTLDLYTEFRNLTNGAPTPHGNGLLAALLHFGLPAMAAQEKDAMRDLILGRGPWTMDQRKDILSYCESDVDALAALFPVMASQIDWPRALLRGRYMQSVGRMEANGVPIDSALHATLSQAWLDIQDGLIASVDQLFGVYEGRTFKASKFEQYLAAHSIPWPRLESGKLDLRDDTFKNMVRSYPVLQPLRELRTSLSSMRLSALPIGEDGRNRCMLSPFRSTTGRNQPSTSKFIFGPSAWMRGLIRPQSGWGLAYVDWSQQEFGIAAALSGDKNMMFGYSSGDPYLAFAKQAGAVPQSATKLTHKAEREQFKACVLAVQYGMGAESLALRINQPVARAHQLLKLHRQTYRTFWSFSGSAVDEALLNRKICTTYGWHLRTGDDPNDRSLRNFPMQANGAEMLRIACVLMHDAGIRICAPVHDALLIEAPLDKLDDVVQLAQDLMRQASRHVLAGFELSSDAKIVRYPDRYMDERGTLFWDTVMAHIGHPAYDAPAAA